MLVQKVQRKLRKNRKQAAPIKIATKPMTEQFILGEMLKLVIEDTTDYSVELTKGIGGGTNNIMPAMESGDFDLYPEYTSSGYIMVLKHDSDGISDEDMWKQLQKEYKDKYDMSWIGQYGFNNTYALIIREEAAKKYNLTKTSQLADVSDALRSLPPSISCRLIHKSAKLRKAVSLSD